MSKSILRDEIRKMVRLEPAAGGGGVFRAVMTVDPALVVFPDHFPGHPILPGMCMMQAVLAAGAAARGVKDLRLTTLKSAKFMRPMGPGDSVILEGRIDDRPDGLVGIKAKILMDGRSAAEFSLEARAEGETP
jgi:3-hydroxyacyl-[acyl-carrier-protein] dehydratase